MKGINFFILLLLLIGCSSADPRPESIRARLENKRDAFRQCYTESNSYRGRDEASEGKVKVSFTIASDGSVIDEKIAKSDFKDPNMHACLLEQLRRIKFTPPPQSEDGGIVVVTQELNLRRRSH